MSLILFESKFQIRGPQPEKARSAKDFNFVIGVSYTKESFVERGDLLGWYKFIVFLR